MKGNDEIQTEATQSGVQAHENAPFCLGEVIIEPQLSRVTDPSGQQSYISTRQMKALTLLSKHSGALVERSDLHQILCRSDEGCRDKGALSHHINLIRKALGDDAKKPRYLKTIRGKGYSLLIKPSAFVRPSAPDQLSPSPIRALLKSQRSFNSTTWRTSLVFLVVIATFLTSSVSGVANKSVNQDVSPMDSLNRETIFKQALLAGAKSGTKDSINATVSNLRQQYRLILADESITQEQKLPKLNTIGDALLQLQAWEDANQAFSSSLAIQRNRSITDQATLATTLLKLAQSTSVIEQSIDSSRLLLVEAIELMRSSRPSTIDLARHLAQQANLASFGKDYERATALVEEALEIAQQLSSENSVFTLGLRRNLANNLSNQGKHQRARSILQNVYQAQKTIFGNESSEVFYTILEMAKLADKMDQHSDSISQYRSALDIAEHHLPDHHPVVLSTKVEMANALTNSGNGALAVDLYQEAIQSVYQYREVTPAKVGSLKLGLAKALLADQQTDLAFNEAQSVIELVTNNEDLPRWMPYFANSLYGAVLLKMGQCEEGANIINQTVTNLFIDQVVDPEITSVVFQRHKAIDACV